MAEAILMADFSDSDNSNDSKGKETRTHDDQTLFDLLTIVKLFRSLSQDQQLRKARELGIRITPKDLRRGGVAVPSRLIRHIRKPNVWARLRDEATWCYADEIARVRSARNGRVVDDLLNEGVDWATVYWICLKAGKYRTIIARRYGEAGRDALQEARARAKGILEAADGLRKNIAEGQVRSLAELQKENRRLTKGLCSAEKRIGQLKRDLQEARKQVKAHKRAAWEAGREADRIRKEAEGEIESMRGRVEAAETSARRKEEEAETLLRATVFEHEEQLAVLRAVIEQQDAEIIDLLASRKRGNDNEPPEISAASVLRGRTICVVGGDTRMTGYRAILEGYGAEMVFASALEKTGQIEGAVSGADGVVLIAAYASHKAGGLVRQACERFGKPVAPAHNAGLATFERVLVTDLAPKLSQDSSTLSG